MISLFLDTSSKKLAIYLVKDNNIIYENVLETINDHSSIVVPSIEEGLANNNIKTSDIDRVYVVVGPGSFTGTRIGVTIGKTICYSNDIMSIPVSSLKQYVFGYDNYDYYVSIIVDKNKFYYGIYDRYYNDVISDKYDDIDELKKDINNLSGNIIIISDKIIDGIKTNEQKIDIIKLMNYYSDKGINYNLLKPNYLKKIEAEKND